MRVLLTGAAGFIGSHIDEAVRAAGHEVVGIDGYLASAHSDNTAERGDVRRIDVRDGAALDEVLRGVDVVCHQAAVVGAGVGTADAPAYASHNDFGTAVLLAAMGRSKCRRMVLASSMVVYGEGRYRTAAGEVVDPAPRRTEDLDNGMFDNRTPVTDEILTWDVVDEDAPLRPRSTYAASKLAQENYAFAWAAATGGSVTALRYHNVYGDHMPRDTPYSGVAAMFRSSLEAGKTPTVYEDGLQTRDFVHVSDVAAANIAAIEAGLDGFVPLNVCSGYPITIGEVAAILSSTRGGPEPHVTGQYRSGDVRHIVASPERARGLLGFTARVTPEVGLAEFAFAPLRDSHGNRPPAV